MRIISSLAEVDGELKPETAVKGLKRPNGDFSRENEEGVVPG
jgi:hypothetical protein